MNNSETLCSLAMLRVHAEHGWDYFDYLVPFVTYVLQKEKPDKVIRGLAIAALVWGVMDAVWGLTIKQLAERCGKWFERGMISVLVRIFAFNLEEF